MFKMDFNETVAWLERNKIDYTIKYNRIVLFDKRQDGYLSLVVDEDKIKKDPIPHSISPSSQADGSDFYVMVGDWGNTKKLIPWAKDMGYYEYNRYHTAQWGTWKFGNFKSMSSFDAFIKKALELRNAANESMNLKEAKEILNKNGYRLVEDTAREHREYWQWKLEFKKALKKLSPKINVLEMKGYIKNALDLEILGRECLYHYKHGSTPEEYAKLVLEWFNQAWDREG